MAEPVRILLAEDLPTDAELAEREIRKTVPSCVFQVVDTQPEYLAALDKFRPDLIITDYRMPLFDGLTALKLAMEFAPLTPVIILTGAINEETAVACMKAGATDYVIKEHIKRLGQAVRHALEEGELRRRNKEAEKALKEKSVELDRFFTLALDLLCIADTDGYFHRLNPQWEVVLGYSLSELDGQRFLDFVHPDDLESTLAVLSELNEQKPVLDFVNRYRCKDGSYRWIEWRSYPSGNLMYAAARDITQRKQMEETLRERELFLRKSQSVGRVGSYYFDIETGKWTSSPTYDEIFGIDENYPRDIAGWIALVHPDQKEKLIDRVSKYIFEGDAPYENEYRIIRQTDRAERWVHGERELEFNEQGEAIKMIGTVQDITERKLMEEALRESERSLRKSQSVAQIGSYYLDVKTGQFTTSPVVDEIFGMNENYPRDITGWTARVHPEHRTEMLRYMTQHVLIEHNRFDKEYPIIRHNDQKLRWVHGLGEVELDENGQANRLVGTLQDITEQKEAEQRLRESEERLQRFSAVTTEGIIFHHQGKIVDANRALTQMFGYKQEEVIGCEVLDFVAPESFELVMQKIALGVEEPYEALSIRKDGMIFPVEIVARAYEYQGQNMRVACIHDITERKRIEAALVEREERLRQAVLASRIGIFDHDHIADTVYLSPEFREIWGWGPDEPVSNSELQSRVHPEDYARVIKAVQDCHDPAGDGSYDVEHRMLLPDGSVRWQSSRAQTFFAGEGNDRYPIRTIGASLDVTETKLAEIAQAELEEKLRQSQKLESLGRLAGGIAHDFNNLLVPIIGYTELAQMRLSPGDKLHNYLNKINTAAERAVSLTKQILAFSRRQMLEVQVFNLNDIVAEFKDMLQRLIGEDINLELFLAATPCLVKADRTQIEQILLNICINARDAMPVGGQLIIETGNVYLDEAYAQSRPDTQPGHHVMLSLSDTGHGMDDETKLHIFEPFFTTKEKGQGTGLGLATVFGIVKQHQGNIWVYSEPGQGTTFKIYLPRAEETAILTTITGSERPATHGTETIMIVEDEPMVRKLARETLEAYGYTIIEADSPGDGLLIASSYEGVIDLLLTDVIMPNMNGRELYENIALIRPDIKVLYMSGYTDNVIVHHGVLDPDVNFLQKPFTVRGLAQKIRSVLD
ncbi:MAG: PAS domain S-box protein [Ardenticatenaceae bacterium]|nr:PAS domain S-box protein [Ardenticatenaceae bacterium]MCB9445112.1 PAS domain S-box protein [Ardenticatenaceae bacterium]